jgi:hypothetical protein
MTSQDVGRVRVPVYWLLARDVFSGRSGPFGCTPPGGAWSARELVSPGDHRPRFISNPPTPIAMKISACTIIL